ncbi:MAG: substrate-binding domain-containing protein [Candidatus Omnitrophica bacterium]|nr:substrate-binding domain-containing protein [Candidatus Omnitrophota bacterium]HOX55222.1 substrate-binding domain-containing protein [Candidatus Omnitrophota bacterium]
MNKIYALIIPRFEDIFHSYFSCEVIKGASVAASRLKVDLLVHITERYSHQDWLTSSLLNPKNIDGILFADIDSDLVTLKKVIAKKIPYIVMNNFFEEPINCISIDNKKAAMEVADYLVELGHTDIATIAGDLTTQAGKLRLEGYKEALDKKGIKIKDEYVGPGNFLRSSARLAAMNLLKLKNPPTAIFAASDIMALEVIDVAKSYNLVVPKELSVVGFDDNPINVYSPIGLTTVSQPLMEMGRIAVEKLDQIVLGKLKPPVKVFLGTKLIKRATCAKPERQTNEKI